MPIRDLEKRQQRLVTADDIAAKLNISQSTVSRAFTPRASISPTMRQRVLAAASELGYRPNAIARTLIGRRSDIVGLAVASLNNPFYSEVLELFSKRLQGLGKQLLLSKIPADADVASAVPALMQYQVDAIVVASASIRKETAREWARQQFPVLLFNRHVAGVVIPAICSDHRTDGRHIARFLLDRGYRRIAFAAGTTDSFTSAERELGFLEGLAPAKLKPIGRAGGEGYTYEAGVAATRALLPLRPDCIVFANSLMALGGMDCIRHERGLRIPQDVAAIGFNDIAMCAWPSYNLTTIRAQLVEMIDLTISAIDVIVDGKPLPSKPVLVPGMLIERGSTRPRGAGAE